MAAGPHGENSQRNTQVPGPEPIDADAGLYDNPDLPGLEYVNFRALIFDLDETTFTQDFRFDDSLEPETAPGRQDSGRDI